MATRLPVRYQRRIQAILFASDGYSNCAIGLLVGADVGVVGKWRRRYAKQGLTAIVPGARLCLASEDVKQLGLFEEGEKA